MQLLWLVLALFFAPPSSPPADPFADDVVLRWRLGPEQPDGRRARLGLELVDGRDAPIWFVATPPTALPDPTPLDEREIAANWVRKPPPWPRDECLPQPEPGELPRTFVSLLRPREVVVADANGVRAYARDTGRRVFEWTPPERKYAWPTPPSAGIDFLAYDEEREGCRGVLHDLPHADACDDEVVVWFDGATFAVFQLDAMKLLGRRPLKPERIRTDDVSHWLRTRVAGWRFELETLR